MTDLTREIDLMRTGKFTTAEGEDVTITEDHLQDIAATTNTVMGEMEWSPPAFPGHGEGEKPMYGTFRDLRVEGGRLLAKFTTKSKEIFDGLKEGFMDQRSAEVYKDVTRVSGVPDSVRENAALKGKPALKGVAFLGGTNPAIKGLKPLSVLLSLGEGEINTYTFAADGQAASTDHGHAGESDDEIQNKDNPMSDTKTVELAKFEELQAKYDAIEKERDALQAGSEEKNDLVKGLSDKVTKLEEGHRKEIQKIQNQMIRGDLEHKVAELKRQGKVMPYEENTLVDTLMLLPNDPDDKDRLMEYGEGDKAEKVTPRENFLRMLKARDKSVKYGEPTMPHGKQADGEPMAPEGFEPDSYALDQKVRAYAEEHEIDISTSAEYVRVLNKVEKEERNG